MKRLTLLACLAAMLPLVPAASAQDDATGPGKVAVGIGAQFWAPKALDDFMDEPALWGADLLVRVRPVRYFGIDLRAGAVGAWASETYWYDGYRYDGDVTFTCVPLEFGAVLMLPLGDSLTLYGGGGGGYYTYDCDIEISPGHRHHRYRSWKIDESVDMENDFGWYALAGLEVRLCPHLSLYAEARYTSTEISISHPDDYDFPVEESDFDMSGVGARAGLMFDF